MNETETTQNDPDKKSKILDIAVEIFAKEGFQKTDVGVIADIAGVGKGTVYRYFGNKEKLFLATSAYCTDRASEFFRKGQSISEDGEVTGDPSTQPSGSESESKMRTLEVLRSTAIAYAKFYQLNPDAVEIMIQERAHFRSSVVPAHLMYRAEHRKRLDNFLRRAIKAGEIRNVDIGQTTNAYADLLFGSVINGVMEGENSDLVARMTLAIDLLLNGLTIKK